MTKAKIYAHDLMADVTMRVEIIETSGYKIRKFLSIQLIKLAAWLLNCDVEVVVNK